MWTSIRCLAAATLGLAAVAIAGENLACGPATLDTNDSEDVDEVQSALTDATVGLPSSIPVTSFGTNPFGWTRHIIDDSLAGADGVRGYKLDTDSLTDLIVGFEQAESVVLYKNPGAGGAADAGAWRRKVLALPAGCAVEDAFAGDLDHDNVLDIVATCEGDGQNAFGNVVVFWGPGDKDYWSASWNADNAARAAFPVQSFDLEPTVRREWMTGFVLDVDGDGQRDLVIGGKIDSSDTNTTYKPQVGWLENPGTNRRTLRNWKYRKMSDATWIMSLFPAQLSTASAANEIALTDRLGDAGGFRFLRRPTDAGSPWPSVVVGQAANQPMLMTAGSVNPLDPITPDGGTPYTTDFVVPRKDGSFALYLRDYSFNNTGTSKFKSVLFNFNTDGAAVPNWDEGKSAALAHMDGDGLVDLVLSGATVTNAKVGKRTLVWFPLRKCLYPPTGQTRASVCKLYDIGGPVPDGGRGSKLDTVLPLDLDGDGDVDILTTDENHNCATAGCSFGLVWYENLRL